MRTPPTPEELSAKYVNHLASCRIAFAKYRHANIEKCAEISRRSAAAYYEKNKVAVNLLRKKKRQFDKALKIANDLANANVLNLTDPICL